MYSKIKKIIRRNWLVVKLYSAYIYHFSKKHIQSRREIDKIVDNLMNKECNASSSYKKWLTKDIIFTSYFYSIMPDEYYRYEFHKLSNIGRMEYVGRKESTPRFEKMTRKDIRPIFIDKYRTYQYFKDDYKREIITIQNADDQELFLGYVSRHKTFIVKPYALHSGIGVQKITINDTNQANILFEKLINDGKMVVEEVIQQSPEMAVFHKESVNTIRIVTYNDRSEIRVVGTSIRMGTGNSIVDNGCLSAGVDPETGIIISKGRHANGMDRCIFHPDTNVQILGTKVPRWEEAKALAIRLSSKIPEQKIIGWDLALSVDGWVIVEGNTRPGIQILAADGVGMRNIFNEISH